MPPRILRLGVQFSFWEELMFRYKLLTVGIALYCAIGFAADDPLNGTWKIDALKSSFSNGKFPKNMSITIKVAIQGDQLIYHSVNDTNKDKPSGIDYTSTMDGKPYPATGSASFNAVSVRRLSKNQLEILESKDGDVMVGAIWELFPDGKRFVRRGIAKGADGKSFEYEEFFDKQ
jgi:hypothetical protein